MSKISICYLSPRADLPVNYRAFIAPLRPLARLHCKVTYTSTPRGAHLPLTSTPITKTSHQITSANTIKKTNRLPCVSHRSRFLSFYQSIYQFIPIIIPIYHLRVCPSESSGLGPFLFRHCKITSLSLHTTPSRINES